MREKIENIMFTLLMNPDDGEITKFYRFLIYFLVLPLLFLSVVEMLIEPFGKGFVLSSLPFGEQVEI